MKVLFDIGNVIIRSTHQITVAILWELGVRPDKAPLFFHQKAYGEFARGRITGAQFAQATRDVLEAPWLTDEHIRAAHDAHLYMVDDDVVSIIDELFESGNLFGFVTTTNEWQTEREIRLINLASHFRCPVVRSHRIGMTKTDPGAWPVIFGELGDDLSNAGERLLVDDSNVNNAAAETAGLVTYLYDPGYNGGRAMLRAKLQEYNLFS